MLCLYLEAPFAACRTFTAGWHRPTAGFLTYSAAYGLILNVAGIENRLREEDGGHDGETPASLMQPGLPRACLALGVPVFDEQREPFPRVQTILQQLHNYPVGKDAGIPQELAKGNKNNITPVRREILCNLRAIVCLDNNPEIEERTRQGLAGKFNSKRYGLPFLGDNQYLLNRLEEIPWPLPPKYERVHWYERIEQSNAEGPRARTTRLTIWIDRANLSLTQSALYAPSERPSSQPSTQAWTQISPPTEASESGKPQP